MSKKETLKMNELKRNFLLRFKEVKILFKWDYEKKKYSCAAEKEQKKQTNYKSIYNKFFQMRF